MIRLLLAAVAALSIGISNAGNWSVRTYGDGDAVAVSECDGVTAIDFSITPRHPRLAGCAPFLGGWADLLFSEPRALGPNDERILFELSMPIRCPRTQVLLLPLVRDDDGELFCYASSAAPQLSAPKQSWEFSGAWERRKTPCLYAGEAGAAAQDVYTLESDGVDFTPGRSLTFLGYRLQLRQMDKDWAGAAESRLRTGRIYLGETVVAGETIPYADPFAYADALLPRKGAWNVASQVFDAFQGRPVHESVVSIDYDPEDAASRRRRITFPTGPDGCYWIRWQVTDAAGAVANSGEFRSDVYFNPDTSPVKYADTTRPPVLGVMRVNPDHVGRGVYAPDETAKIEVRVFPKDGEKTSLAWKLLPCELNDVLDAGAVDVPPPGSEGYSTVPVVPKRFADRPAYRLVLTATAGGRTLDEQTYFFGYRNADPLARHDRAGRIVDRREYKKHPYNRTTFSPKGGGASSYGTEEKFFAYYREFLENSCELATSFTYMLDVRDWEVLPGVFDTSLLDRVFDLAADYGMKATVRMAHLDRNGANLYRWHTYDRQVASDGTIAQGHPYYGAYSVPDAKTVQSWLRGYRALHDRYVAHTAFEGYYIMLPGGEWVVVDQPWNGTFSGYDPATVVDFRRWLSARYVSLPALNAAWGASFGSFDEIRPPRPDFRSGARPDLRRAWIDFCRYKSTLGDQWLSKSVNDIRTYDDERITISYGAPRGLAKLLGRKHDYCHNGGNHRVIFLWEFIDAWKDCQIGWITEPHHPHAWNAYGDPTDRGWVLDWSTWIMTAQAAGGGANLHVYYWPWRTPSRTDFWGGVQGLDRFEAYKPILNELHEMEVFRPVGETAFLTDPMTLWTKHRTTFRARLDDLRLWREVIDQDSVTFDNFLPERADEYRLVLPNLLDVAMEAESFSNLVESVRVRGAKTIITAQTGSFVPELAGDEPFQLLKAFGIPPPEQPYCRKGRDVRATFGADGVLAEEGRELPFETGDRLHAQLLDPAVQKRFWDFRFRWLPETDYFGYYPGVRVAGGGRVLATFADGGAAVSLHRAGKGEVIVFWGLPDYDGANMKGLLAAAAKWAGVSSPRALSPVQYFIEGENRRLDRHYLLLWKSENGSYVVNAPHLPDGTWFVDETVSGRRIGLFDGRTVREKGLAVEWEEGYSPLKYLRFSRQKTWFKENGGGWSGKFGDHTK